MATYAQGTTVPVEKSRAEIERTLQRYGASAFVFGWSGDRAMMAFEMAGRRIQFELPLPPRDDEQFWYTPKQQRQRTPEEALKLWEQACRQRWRALALVIKAKLEAVEAGITSFEDEFLAFVALPDGSTVGRWLQPQLAASYAAGRMPSLLPGIDDRPALNSGNTVDGELV